MKHMHSMKPFRRFHTFSDLKSYEISCVSDRKSCEFSCVSDLKSYEISCVSDLKSYEISCVSDLKSYEISLPYSLRDRFFQLANRDVLFCSKLGHLQLASHVFQSQPWTVHLRFLLFQVCGWQVMFFFSSIKSKNTTENGTPNIRLVWFCKP